MSRYYMILHRITHTETSKNSKYKGVELRVSKDDFIKWFMENDFEGASVDRKDSKGHYELENMRLIPLESNIAKEKLISKNGFCTCYRCKQTKPLDEFVKDNRRLTTGRSTICLSCEVERNKNRYRK